MKNLFSLLLSTLTILNAFSQPDPGKHKWTTKKIVYTSDSTGVASLDYNDPAKSGLLFVSQDGAILKELAIPGYLIDIAKWKDHVLAFYSDEPKGRVAKTIHAALVDTRTQAVAKDAVIFTNPGDHQLQCSAIADDEDNFQFLLVFTSKTKGRITNVWEEDDYSKIITTPLQLDAISLAAPFDFMTKPIATSGIGCEFVLGNYANRKGEIGLVTYNKGIITAEKFGLDGQLQKKIECPFEYEVGFQLIDCSHGLFDPNAGESLVFSVANPGRSSRSQLGTFVFDFAKGNLLTLESDKLNKAYHKDLQNNPDLPKSKNFEDVEGFKPSGILFVGDTLITCREIRYREITAPSTPQNWFSEGTIMSFYDRQFHLLHQLFLDRRFHSYTSAGMGLSFHVRDHKVLVFGNETVHDFAITFKNICFVIDPANFSVEKKTVAWGDVPEKFAAITGTVFWFRNSLLKSHSSQQNYPGWGGGTTLVTAAYP
jgi:hypothetical protein